MTTRFAWLLVGLLPACGLFCFEASAQSRQAQMDELQQQIDALTAQLQTLQIGGDDKVTQLGGTRRQAVDKEVMLVRIYDVSDLFAVAPAYPAQHQSDLPGGRGVFFPSVNSAHQSSTTTGFGGGGGFFRVTEASKILEPAVEVLHQLGAPNSGVAAARSSMDDLIEAIQTTIDPASWDQVGGPGAIANVGNSLIISASPSTHKQIDELISLFRRRWGTLRTVTVRAHWLWLGESQLEQLLAAPQQVEGELKVYGAVDPQAWRQYLETLEPDDRPIGYRAAITCYNGQTVHVVAGRQQQVVTNVSPKVLMAEQGPKGTARRAIGYSPHFTLVQEGPALQITPLTNTSGRFVVLDVHSCVAELGESRKHPAEGKAEKAGEQAATTAAAEVVRAIDGRPLARHRLSTTLRVPADRTMLVGGMSFGNQGSQLYLFVQASVQELRDDVKTAGNAIDVPPAKQPDTPAEDQKEK